MARFDLYQSRSLRLYLDVQSNYVDDFGRRVVIPLLLVAKAPPPIPRLHPIVRVEASDFIVVTHRISSVERRKLGAVVGTLSHHQDEIIRALDVLLTGF
jgi:toxin CcdB